MSNYFIVLLFLFVWFSFGALAIFGYWQKNYTDDIWKKVWINTVLLAGGMISLALPLREHRHRHHHSKWE